MSGRRFPDLFVNENGRQLRVCSEWVPNRSAWVVSIKDNSPGKQFTGVHAGDFVVGETELWCYSPTQLKKARETALDNAENGTIR